MIAVAEREAKVEEYIAAKETAKVVATAAAERKRADQAAIAERKARLQHISERLRRARTRCTCQLPIHSDRCRLRGVNNEILWFGADQGVSREDLRWYHANRGRLGGAGIFYFV